MLISEVINTLQEIQKEHGDVEVLAMQNTWGEGNWRSKDHGKVYQKMM